MIHARLDSSERARVLLLRGRCPVARQRLPRREQSVLERDHRGEPELVRGALRVEDASLQLTEAGRRVHRLRARAGGGAAQVVELDNRGLAPGPDVEDPAFLPERGQRRPGDVADVDVVAGLEAVAEDARLLVAGEGAEEDRDDAGLAVRILARPVDVPVPERDVDRPVEAVVRAQVLLGGELRGAVRRDREARRRLLRGLVRTRRRSRRRSS